MASPTAQKLGIRAGATVLVDGPAQEAARLGPLPDGVTVGDPPDADIVIQFAAGVADVAATPGLMRRVRAGGRLWVAYRKGASRRPGGEVPLHRDTLQAALEPHGLVGVSLVAIDDTWSAMRVREA